MIEITEVHCAGLCVYLWWWCGWVYWVIEIAEVHCAGLCVYGGGLWVGLLGD